MKTKGTPCPLCGTWACRKCGWRRDKANRLYAAQYCLRCDGTEGYMLPITHRDRRIQKVHEELYDREMA